MDSIFRWVLAAVMLLGSPFLVIGGCEALETRSELARSVRGRGTIAENRLVVDQRDGVEEHAYQPVVQFRDAAGHVHRFTDAAASLPPDYAVGETVEVAFEPRDPAHARIVSWKRLWLVPTLFGVVGVLPTLSCALILRRLSRA